MVSKLIVNSDQDQEGRNYADQNNIILGINPQTGTVSTNQVYPPYCSKSLTAQSLPLPPFPINPPSSPPTDFDPNNPPAVNYVNPYPNGADTRFMQSLFYSRKFAREAQTMGGKR
jgi:hypothetical protein